VSTETDFGSSDTRDAILEAAERLLYSRESFSMAGVAKAAGVSRQAVYLHFSDRYGLLDAAVRRASDRSELELSRRAIEGAPTGRDALDRYVETTVSLASAHGALDQAVRAVLAADPKLADRWAKRRGRQRFVKLIVDRLEAEGDLADDMDPQTARAVLLAFSAPAFMVPIVDHLELDAAVNVVRRSIGAAVLA
jgi:AcrR family transcriptional regulator